MLLSGLKEYIRPCFNNRPKDSLQTSLSIIDGVFKCIDSLYNFFGLDSTASASPQYIDSVYRIIIYACIWVCGVCSNSASSRDDFDKWFKEKYESVNERERNRKLFPSMQATTIFSSYLQHGINNGTSAEWILFEETKAQLNAPPSLTTSEDRERYSLLSLYYSSVNDPLYTKNSASLLVPTATSLAYSVIQSAIMNTGAMLIISGSEGSGKSSLLNALIRHLKAINPTNKANSMAAASRWVCQINDCGPLAMFSHMLRCKLDLSTKRLEYNFSHESNLIYDNGALFVDDVHLSAHVDNHTTCIETIRNLQERKELYNFERKKWQNMARLYVVLAARGEPKKRLNRRLIRHGLLICCQELEVRDCFATKLVHEVPSINQEVVRDLVNLTFNYTTHLKHLCLEAFTEGSGLEGVVKSFYSLVIKNKPISSSVDYLLGKMACALTSMTVFTTNDVLRIWDRTIADFTNRYEPIDEIASQALERIISDYHYDFPSFISVVEREKLMRMSAREAVKVLDSNYSVSNIISYTKNTNGFHKTAANVYPGIDIAEALRDKYLKSIATEKSKHMLTSLGLDLNSLSLWTDVQATLSNLQVRHSSNPLHILVVSGQPQRTVDILLCVCGDYQGEHVWKLNLDPKTIYNANKNIYLGVGAESPTYGALKAEGRDDRFERIAKVLSNDMDRKRTPFLRKSLVLPGNINTNSTSSEDVPSLNLYQLITILLFRKLFSDLSVLGHLKDYLETLTDTDKTRPQSPRRSVTIPTITFAAGVTNIWCRSVVMECHRRLSAVLVDNNFSMPVKDEATICYLPVSKEFARIDNVWDFMSDALSYRSDYADEIITRIHPRLSLRSSYEVRCIVSDYVARQRYVFCFDNPFSNSNFNRNYSDKCEDFKRDEDGLAKVCEGMEQMIHTKSIEDLFSTKRLTPFTIYLPLTSHGYYVAENILNTICGNELAEKVFSLIQNYWRTLVQRFSPNHDDCMQMCGGAQYLLSAVESLHKTYKLLLQSGTKWKSAQKRCWKYVFELYGVDKNTDLAHSEQPTEGGPPIEVQNDTESAPAFSQEIFADAVYITIFSRFFNVVQRTHGAVHDSTALIAELEQLDLHISITDEMRLYDAGSSHRFAEFLPLILLLAMSKVSPTKSLNIGIIISLPITSPLKNLLILIGFLRILRIDFDLIDHTFITSLLLENTLETMADLTHSPTSKFLYSSSISTISVYRQAVLQVDKSAASTTPIFRGKPSSLREAEDSRKKVRNVDCMELENFSQNIKVPIVIPSLSPLTNDAFVLYFIQNGLITPAVPRIVSCFEFLYEASADFIENVLINSDELTKANTDKAPEKANAAVDMTVYESVWKGTCEGLSRSLGVVAVIIQASKSVEELNRSEIMRSLWYQFEKLLRLVLVEHFVNKANSPRGAEVLSESIRSVLSKTTFLLLGKLEELLNSNRYLSLILYVSLKVHFDNTTVEGSRSIGKVIALLSALKGSPVGISMKDIGQKYSEINFAEIIHEEDDELDDDSEADESDSSKHHISSQTLKLVRQYLEFVTKSLNTAKPGHSIFGRYAASTDGGRVAKIGTISTTIVNSIEENISTWLEWIAAPQETPLPVTTGCTLGHLEQLILILLFKPLDLRFHLHKLIAEVGLGCNYSDAAVLEGISQSNSLNNAISGHDIIVHNPEGCNNSLSIIINEKVGDQTSSYALLSTYSIKNYMLYNFNSTLQQFVGNTSTGGDVDSANQSPVGSPYSKAPLFMNDDIISYGISIGLLSPRHKNLILKRKGMLDKSLSMIDSAAMSSRDLLSLNRRISNRSFSRSREDDEEVDIHGRLIGCYNQKPAVYTVLSSGQMDCPSLHSRIADKTAPSMSENIPSYVFLCSGDNRMVTLYDTNTIFVRTNREEYSANSCNNKSLSSARTSKICPTFELPITHKLISYENYHNVLRIFAYCIKDLPIKSLSAGALLVVRLRWLLVFFHTSVSYHLRNAGIYIAADLLVSAAHLIDDIFANLDNFLVETSGNSNGEKKNIITVEKLCEFVVGGVYSTAVTLEMSYRSLSALFTSYLLPGCCDPDSNYTILGNIKLPKDFSEATINSFLEELMSAMNGNASYIELLGSSVTTSSTSVTRAIVDGLGVIKSCNSSCNISNDKMNLLLFRDLKLFLEEKSINSYLANAAVFHLFTQEIEKLVPLIPEKINMESRAIVKRISEHTLGATALLNSAGNKKKVFNPAERRVSNIVNDRRKRGGKIGLVRLQAKEYDSLWAFAMAESHHYNKTVESWRRQLATVASSAKNASTSGMNILHYFESIGIQVRNCTHDLTSIAHMVNSIVNSMTPECWRQSTETHSHNPRISISDNVSVADWFAQLSDRRKVLFDWLTNGYPGAVKLHLLTNPEEFFQALKETYAVKADSSATADKVHFVFTVLNSTTLSPSDIQYLGSLNHSCNVILEDIYLHNAFFQEKNSSVEFFSDYTTSTFGKVCNILY